MTQIAMLPGSALRPGYIIRNHGFRWEVVSVKYDIRGNMGSNFKPNARYCVAARWVDDGTCDLPEPYRNMGMGLCTELLWAVEVPQ